MTKLPKWPPTISDQNLSELVYVARRTLPLSRGEELYEILGDLEMTNHHKAKLIVGRIYDWLAYGN